MENTVYNIGEKYKRINIIGCGESGKGLTFNDFSIVSITTKFVLIYGHIASGLLKSRKINLVDFETFLKNYLLIK